MALRKLSSVANEHFADAKLDEKTAVALLQARILHALFSNPTIKDRDTVLVKGGIAMQMLAGNTRSTEDIDLSADPSFFQKTLKKNIENSINIALQSGFIEDAKVEEEGWMNGGVNPKFYVRGRLAGSDANISVKLEVSRREQMPEECIDRFEYTPPKDSGLAKYTVKTFSPMAMASSKVVALLDNKRNKIRDVYDLFLLIDMTIESPAPLLAARGKPEISKMIDLLAHKVSSFSYKDFNDHVRPSLSKEMSDLITADRWHMMKDKVFETVFEWLEDAHEIATDQKVDGKDLRGHFANFKDLHERSVSRKRM